MGPANGRSWTSTSRRFTPARSCSIGTAACPPYHLAVVVGGTSAGFALKPANYASVKNLDDLPTSGPPAGHTFGVTRLEQEILELTPPTRHRRPSSANTYATTTRWCWLPGTGGSCSPASSHRAAVSVRLARRLARHRPRQDEGAPGRRRRDGAVRPGPRRVRRRLAKTPDGCASGSLGPTTAGRTAPSPSGCRRPWAQGGRGLRTSLPSFQSTTRETTPSPPRRHP